MLRMAIVGHRRLGDPDTVRFVADACERLLRRVKNIEVIANRQPRIGEPVATLDFPPGLPLKVTRGRVRGHDRTTRIDGIRRHRLIQTDAVIYPGHGGGPLISAEAGALVGLVDATFRGIVFAVSPQVARALLAAWKAAVKPLPRPAVAPSSHPEGSPVTTPREPPKRAGDCPRNTPLSCLLSRARRGDALANGAHSHL